MYCPKCEGFGFYNEVNADGSKSGKKCDHKVVRNFTLSLTPVQPIDTQDSTTTTEGQ